MEVEEVNAAEGYATKGQHLIQTIGCGSFAYTWKGAFLPTVVFGGFLGDHQTYTTPTNFQEDVNGEKLTVKKWWIFGADFFHGLVPIFSRFTPTFHGL